MLKRICIPTYEFCLELVVPFLLVLPKLSFYRSFSGLRLIKSYLRNRMSDEWLSGFCTHALTSWPWNSCWQNLYNLCYQAPEEDVPRVDLLRVDFKYTVRGQGIITCISTAGRGVGLRGKAICTKTRLWNWQNDRKRYFHFRKQVFLDMDRCERDEIMKACASLVTEI